jgi:hypothetical protein
VLGFVRFRAFSSLFLTLLIECFQAYISEKDIMPTNPSLPDGILASFWWKHIFDSSIICIELAMSLYYISRDLLCLAIAYRRGDGCETH